MGLSRHLVQPNLWAKYSVKDHVSKVRCSEDEEDNLCGMWPLHIYMHMYMKTHVHTDKQQKINKWFKILSILLHKSLFFCSYNITLREIITSTRSMWKRKNRHPQSPPLPRWHMVYSDDDAVLIWITCLKLKDSNGIYSSPTS